MGLREKKKRKKVFRPRIKHEEKRFFVFNCVYIYHFESGKIRESQKNLLVFFTREREKGR